MNERQALMEHLGKKLIVSVEENKPMLIKGFKKYHGIKKKRRRRISSKDKREMQLNVFDQQEA
jgi:hypothetical protein